MNREIEINSLAKNYGSLDILSAYLMHSRKISLDEAEDIVYELDEYIERILDDREEHKDEEEEC